ncbi:hypothetical protein D3C79_970320 [compost metagenome]
MRRKCQLFNLLRPVLIVRLQPRQPGRSRLLHYPMLRRYAVLAVEDNAQWLAQIFTWVEALSGGIQLIPTHRQRRIVGQHGGAGAQDGGALRSQTLHVLPRLR